MKFKLRLAKWIYKNLSADPSETMGGAAPPGDWLRHQFGPDDEGKPMYAANTSNDGFEIWIAYSVGGKWLVHFDAKTARQLAKFILWDWWAKATWFGLKRKIWYWALHITITERRKWQIPR